MQESAPRNRRVWIWLAILTPMVLLGTAALLVLLGALFNASGQEIRISTEERALLLDIEHLTNWMRGYEPDQNGESARKVRYFDDSFEIEYVYDAPAHAGAPYLTYSLTFEGSESDARSTYASFWGGTKAAFLVLGDSEIAVLEKSDLFRWGDKSRFGVLTTDGEPFGNVFLARRGEMVVYLLLSGFYFDESETISELLTPYLARLERYHSAPER